MQSVPGSKRAIHKHPVPAEVWNVEFSQLVDHFRPGEYSGLKDLFSSLCFPQMAWDGLLFPCSSSTQVSFSFPEWEGADQRMEVISNHVIYIQILLIERFSLCFLELLRKLPSQDVMEQRKVYWKALCLCVEITWYTIIHATVYMNGEEELALLLSAWCDSKRV